jgi:hypothetical protein
MSDDAKTDAKEPYRDADPPDDDKSPDALFEALWGRCLDSWDDDKPHHALLDHALQTQRLPDLAGRYRKIKETEPDKAERAEKKINGIVVAATQMLMAQKTPARTKTPLSWTISAAVICAIVCLWLAYKLFLPH